MTGERYLLLQGDVMAMLATLADNSVDSVVTDPPYELKFMGKSWDSKGIAYSLPMWREVFRVLKPGGHLLSFGGSRTYHRMACAVEDAGFEIRDQIMWLYGSGMPKSLNVSKSIDKAAGAVREVVGVSTNGAGASPQKLNNHDTGDTGIGILDGSGKVFDITVPATDAAKQWDGWGSALKPAHEPVVVARKPLVGTVIKNVLEYGTGAINIDACRVAPTGETRERVGEASQDRRYDDAGVTNFAAKPGVRGGAAAGRWPANVIHDGSDEVLAEFPEAKGQQGDLKETGRARPSSGRFGDMSAPVAHKARVEDNKSASRFFYCAKTSPTDRDEGLSKDGNSHPTVKPTQLMRHLCRLVTPPDGTVLDPLMGSGSTGKAALLEGFNFLGIDENAEYVQIANARLQYVLKQQGNSH